MPNDSGEKLLAVENLQVSYGVVQVLWGISFAVAKGKVTCIIGSNGAGKTTALNAIAGMRAISSGRILMEGENITAFSARQRVERHISLVPEGRQLWPGMSVAENLFMGCFLPGLRSRAKTNLARVYDLFPRLKERQHQMAGTLSGGEQQMCAIGRGLMSEPRLLLLDEPSLGLAPILVEEIFKMIREIANQGVTILLVGENVNYTLQVANYGYVMEVGRITFQGPAASLSGNEDVRRAYLGM